MSRPGRDEGDRPAILGHALIQVSAHHDLAGQAGLFTQPEAVQRLMRTMGLTSISRRPRISRDGARAQGVSLSVSLAVLNFSKVAVENVPPCEIGPVPFFFSQGRRGWGDEQGGSYCVTPLLERRATQNGGGPPAGRVLIGLG